MIEYLTLEDLLALIEDLDVGPIRDVGLLDSALHRPQATVYGNDAYDLVIAVASGATTYQDAASHLAKWH